MNFNAEQFTAAHQANLTAAAGLSQTAFAGFERLVELNMAAGKAAVGESFANMQALMGAKSPQDLMAVQAALVQPAFEKSVSYGRHLADIANSTGAEFTKAVESKMAESEQAVKSLVENSLKNVLTGAVKLIEEENTLALRIARPPVRLKESSAIVVGIEEGKSLNISNLTLRKANIEETDTLLDGRLLDNRGLADAVLGAKHDRLVYWHFTKNTLGKCCVHFLYSNWNNF